MPPSSEVLATIPVGLEPKWVAVAPDGRRAYVTRQDRSGATIPAGVAVIDTHAKALRATVAVGGPPSGIVVSPDGRFAYAPNFFDGHGVVSVIVTSTTAIADTIVVSGLGGGPNGVAMTPDGSRIYVATDHEVDGPDDRGKVSVIDTRTRTVVAAIISNPFPASAAISPDGRFVYVLSHDGDPGRDRHANQRADLPFRRLSRAAARLHA